MLYYKNGENMNVLFKIMLKFIVLLKNIHIILSPHIYAYLMDIICHNYNNCMFIGMLNNILKFNVGFLIEPLY